MTPRLGLTPHDPARLAASPDIFDHLHDVSVPASIDRSGVPVHPSLGANGWAPDCTGESLREYANAVSALGEFQLAVQPNASLRFYCGCVGLPADATEAQIEATDGIDMMTAAAHAFSGFDTGYQKFSALWGKTQTNDINVLAAGSAKFGLLWVGGVIYQRDQDTLYSSGAWDDDGETDQGAVVGGHAFCSGWGYTGLDPTSITRTITWGMQKPTTWRWLMRRAQVVLCLRWPQLDRAGSSPVDEAALTAALMRWAA